MDNINTNTNTNTNEMNKYENNNENNHFTNDDFVVTTTSNGEFVGGGYKINSLLLNAGSSPMITINRDDQIGGKVSSPFEHLAVPAGLFYVNMHLSKNKKKYGDNTNIHYKPHETITDDMVDKLYSLIEIDKKQKRKTKKHNNKHNNKTRKMK